MLNSIIIVEQKDSAGTMFFEGEITIPSANELKNALINSLDKFNCVTLNFEKATAADLTCLQLLLAAYRTSKEANKNIMINGCSEPFKRAVADAACTYFDGCILECENNCSDKRNTL